MIQGGSTDWTTKLDALVKSPVTEIEEYLAEHRDKPYVLCEYAHAMV